MIKDDAVHGLDNVINDACFCEEFVYGKLYRLSYKKHENNADKYNVGECIYMDLCGPVSVSLGGHKLFMLAKDNKSS